MHTIILIFGSKSTFFTKKTGIFLLNIGMNIHKIVGILQENRKKLHIAGEVLNQYLCKAESVYEDLPEYFTAKYQISPNTILGLETVPAGKTLELHTDTEYNRYSNMLINISNIPVTITHHNNDVLEHTKVLPMQHFVLNTTKAHGCENITQSDAEFLTINWSQTYEQVLDRNII